MSDSKLASNPMPYETRERLFNLRCRSKRGESPSPGDMKFLEDCWKKWPKEYEAMGSDVFIETAPFGSRI